MVTDRLDEQKLEMLKAWGDGLSSDKRDELRAAGKAILSARQRTASGEPGYTLTHGELEAGASGAAAPLLGVTGVEGSVGVVMLADAVPERVGQRVMDAAREVAEALR